MHERLSEMLGREVVGEVTKSREGLANVALGRILLDPLDPEGVGQIVGQLRQGLSAEVEVARSLELDSRSGVAGLTEIRLRTPDSAQTYLLQISTATVISLYERRFWLGPDLLGDVMGAYVEGLRRLRDSRRDRVLTQMAGLDAIEERFQELVGLALRGPIADKRLLDFAEALAQALRLVPWSVRATLRTLWNPSQNQLVSGEPVPRRLLLFAAESRDGRLAYQYAHRQNPDDGYDEVLSWMTRAYQTLVQRFPAPGHIGVAAHASSVEQFLAHFPRCRPVLGENPAEEA